MVKRQTLTRKQEAFIDYYLTHPKASGTEAALAAYNTTDPVVAASISYKLFRKGQIIERLASVGELSQEALIGAVRDWGQSPDLRRREIALNSAKYLHDKVFGRAAVATTDVRPDVVSIAINLTGDGDQPPADML